MKYASLFLAPVLAFAAGCNTAQVTIPAVVDAGPPCPTLPPVITCDAGTVTPGACAGAVTLTLDYPDASNTVPAGSYELGCSVGFFVQDPASPDCLRTPSCMCVAPDAGPVEDGGDAGVTTAPGVWSCFATQ